MKIKNNKKVDWNKDLDEIFGAKFRKIVSGIIVKGIKDGLTTGRDIHGKQFKKLKAATVRAKKRAKNAFPSKPLIATGVMKKLPPVRNKGTHHEIKTADSRSSIAMYHNEGFKPQKEREWFGVTKDAKEDIGRAIGKKVVHILKRNKRV